MIEQFATMRICLLLLATSSPIRFERILFRDWVTILGGIRFGFDATLGRGKPLLQVQRLCTLHLHRQRRFPDRHVNERRADGEDDVYVS